MFTGLIADLGRVQALRSDGEGVLLDIQTRLAEQLSAGDSVAVNGVCLTATDVRRDGFAAHAMAETLRRSALGGLRGRRPREPRVRAARRRSARRAHRARPCRRDRRRARDAR